MTKFLWISTLLLTCLSLGTFADTTIEIKPGNWQTKIMLQMSNMPFAPPPRTITRCMSADTNDAMIKLIADETLGPDCQMNELSQDANSNVHHWTFQCTGRRPSQGDSWLTVLGAQHYQIKTEMEIFDAGGGIMKVDSESRRLGDCN